MPATSRSTKAGRKRAGRRPPFLPIEKHLTEAPGDASPGDPSPEYAGSVAVPEEEASFCENPQSEEALLDVALELTFPASDPIAETPLPRKHSACPDGDELMLDDAIALTFPASDPVAFTPHARTRH